MREQVIEQKLKEQVEQLGGLCEKWNSGSAGWPDRIVLMPDGRMGFVEVKAPGKKLRPLQVKRHRQLGSLGFKVYVLDGEQQIRGIIHEIQGT